MSPTGKAGEGIVRDWHAAVWRFGGRLLIALRVEPEGHLSALRRKMIEDRKAFFMSGATRFLSALEAQHSPTLIRTRWLMISARQRDMAA